MCKPLLASLLLMIATPNTADPLRLTNFDRSTASLGWQIVNDTVMGGRSQSRFVIADQALTFSGVLNINGGGFASLRSQRLAQDLTGYDAVRLRVKGEGREYRFRLFVNGDRASYQQGFTTVSNEWQVITLAMDQFWASWRGRRLQRPPVDASDVSGVGFILADGIDGEFKLQVDWIEFYRSSNVRGGGLE